VRLDEASAAALDVLRAGGMNDSEAVRSALREAASKRRTNAALREEAARLAAHPADREEVRAILELMDELAPGDED
jgi:Arc/MetJ-type ribon-helix-helix transcriptional regulator